MPSLIESDLEGRVFHLVLNRPEKRNALNLELCRQLADAIEAADRDPGISAILLTGKGKAFCAGMDLDEVASGATPAIDEVHERLFTVAARVRKPIVAGASGAALGGGMGLAANSHVLIAGPDATFGLTEIRLGLWPFLVFRAVAAAIGERRAVELSLTGETLNSTRSKEIGLVSEIAADPVKRAAEVAAHIAGSSATAIRNGLAYVQAARGQDLKEAGETARRLRAEVMASAEFAEGLRRFREK